ncbi:cytidine deaminase [Novosphingobium fuchskuhlense]|uniref:Cytidine deaminase n=1 Tax=Novosphingobium fuchskuhlense TaxID=1117702 RepID=A0A117UWM7_9SPHN|nr:cytidine deaminase [Novosphingobium fuchskuhlense]KUR72251.1 cytidine deaminase [Novosphingobium fuchskuhlense]
MSAEIDELVAAAMGAARGAYAPYSGFHVGAVLLFDDGAVVPAANVENASYGLSLCAEANAVVRAMTEGRRGGLVAVVIVGGRPDAAGVVMPGAEPVMPCGRCRQMLHELAALGGSDPEIIGASERGLTRMPLSALLPHAFGPANLA